MSDTTLLSSVATQLMSGDQIEVAGQRLRVRRTNSGQFRTVNFVMVGHEFAAIEQNPDKPSQWGQLARSGHQVVQFRDCATNRFVEVAEDGNITEYGARNNRCQSPAEQK
jgi:hypothetical protein